MVYVDYSDIRGWKGVASSLSSLKQFRAAEKIYALVVTHHPEDVGSFLQLAKCHAFLNNFAKAEELVEKVLAFSKGYPKFHEIRQQAFHLKAALPI